MLFSLSSWIALIATLLCTLRAVYLDKWATADLQGSSVHESPRNVEGPNRWTMSDGNVAIGTEPDNIFYFVQLSDLHISQFQSKGYTIHFLHFLKSALPTISPEFVVVTGDLTDAKDARRITSSQHLAEWKVYEKALSESGVVDGWYDLRGNHDCFDVPGWYDTANMYKDYAVSSRRLEEGQGVYEWEISKGTGKYKFVAFDACPKRGPSRPFNFFGYMPSSGMNRLADSIIGPEDREPYNHTMVFAHYPTTTVAFGTSDDGYTYTDLANQFSVYFCGHLHKLLGGLGDALKGYDPKTHSLELELGDMKDHASYRIVAVDHDLISFVDVNLPLPQIPFTAPNIPKAIDGESILPESIDMPPVVLITNPKEAKWILQYKEPVARIAQSKALRFLIFTQEQDPNSLRVEITIDGIEHPYPAQYKGVGDPNGIGQGYTPLWTSEWDPQNFNDMEEHTLRITVTDSAGRQGVDENVFKVNGARIDINGGPGEWIIWSKLSLSLKRCCILVIGSILALLLIPKLYSDYTPIGSPRYTSAARDPILKRIHTLSKEPHTLANRTRYHVWLWTLRCIDLPRNMPVVWAGTLIYTLMLISLPWFKGEFIPVAQKSEDRYGLFYLSGLRISDEWVPLADTWMFALFEIIFGLAAFVVIWIWRATDSADLHCSGTSRIRTLNERAWFKALVVIMWLWRASEVLALGSFYGGVWPTLVQNSIIWWLLFAGVAIATGKDGIFVRRSVKERNSSIWGRCIICHKTTTDQEEDDTRRSLLDNIDDDPGSHSSSSSSTTESLQGFNVIKVRKSRK
ncbi:Metallo-dependent phosphatase-like protein [Umbelopsis sp. AD052]|nr:Metallo-dependent phosphatase-like protein [Umbelopsis sp. AD052]